MPLVSQVLWGTLFCLPAGFSYSALRLSTLVLSLAGLLTLVALTHRYFVRDHRLLLVPLLLLCNPVFLGLSYTFMTDVPFLTLAFLAILLLLAGIDRPLLFLLGAVAAVATTLLRQTGILIPLAFTGSLFFRKEHWRYLPLAVLLSTTCIATLLGYEVIIRSTQGLSSAYQIQYIQAVAQLRQGILHRQVAANLAATLIYTGIFLLPLNLLLLPSTRPIRLMLFAGIAVAVLTPVQLGVLKLPGNILTDRGLGPFQLRTSESFTAFSTNTISRVIFGLLALVGISLLIEAICRYVTRFRESVANSMLISLAALYFVSILPIPQFDRYMLFYVPLLALPIISVIGTHRRWLWAALSLLISYGLFSVAATHDYLAWNRARWQGLHLLTNEMLVTPDKIDGGFEFNGLYTFSESYERQPGKSRWWVLNDEYTVSLDSLADHEIVAKYRTGTWLPLAPKHIFVLRRRQDELKSQPPSSNLVSISPDTIPNGHGAE